MSDMEKHSVKRKRVTKACLLCARSRRKCDGQQPSCSTCKNQGLQCAWSDVPSRRGPPKGYRRGAADPASLAPKIAKIREQVTALGVAYGERVVLANLHTAIFGDNHACENSWPSRTQDASMSASCSVAGSSVHAAEGYDSRSPMKAKSEWSQDEMEEHNSEAEEGTSSGMAFLASSMSYMQTGSPLTPISDTERLPVEKYNLWALLRNGDRLDRQPIRRYSRSDSNAYIPQPQPVEIEILLKTYWTAIHPHWPILYKPSYDDISIFKINDEVPLALLYAMYALAARLVPPGDISIPPGTFLRVAEEELRSEGPYYSDINTCTTLFLLSLYLHGEGNLKQAWVHSGIAALMALDLGLHKEVKDMPLVEHERRVRVFWNIFVYEKVLSSEMGRPVVIPMRTCDPVRLSEEQSDEYETVVHHATGGAVRLYSISVFNAAVDLFRIFERILTEVHSVSFKFFVRSKREQFIMEIDTDLNTWQNSLGSRCRYPAPDDRTPTRSLYMAHAWYHVAKIILHRPVMARPRAGHTFVSNVHHKIATEHANKLVDLLAQFAAGQEIHKLPPNDVYPIFTAALIHIDNIHVSDKATRDSARPRLEQCIEWLQGLSGTWSSAQEYSKLLNAVSKVAADHMTYSHELSPTVSSPASSQRAGSSQQMTPTTSYPRISPGAVANANASSNSNVYLPPPLEMSEGSTSSRHQQQQHQQHQQQQQQHRSVASVGAGPQPYPAIVQRDPQAQTQGYSEYSDANVHPQQQQQQSYTVNESGQPVLLSLEGYYWNEYAAGANPPIEYYQQQRPQDVHAPHAVYYDVIRALHMQENAEGRPPAA